MKIGFIGDIVGKPGRKMVIKHLKEIKEKEKLDFIIANYENASHGFGITEKNAKELFRLGIDIMTGGNHTWDKKEIFALLESMPLLRPINYPKGVPGKGLEIVEIDGEKLAIINLMGHFTMPMVDNPFIKIKNVVEDLKNNRIKNIFIDMHAEATSEKRALLMMLKGEVSAIAGTHTHIGTDDLQIFDGVGYVTDVGLTGCRDNVIGMKEDVPIKKFLTGLPGRYDIPDKCKKILQMVVFDINEGKCNDAYKIKAYDEEEYFISQKAFIEK
ncbi:TIGR00282 family metallophosphoesterase [Nitrosophilus kaiyonis]|uniref:TIGR00282 family metallophosphoesterase n=1 Tax=Nitrosophilus kaiyonis TaxID=2930200 RepID=UPI00248FAAEF|nr:TIGR00282 family metallophosphoesterase [Nitrosophilus kaiyonis]